MTLLRGLLSHKASVPPGRSKRLHSRTCRQQQEAVVRAWESNVASTRQLNIKAWVPQSSNSTFRDPKGKAPLAVCLPSEESIV